MAEGIILHTTSKNEIVCIETIDEPTGRLKPLSLFDHEKAHKDDFRNMLIRIRIRSFIYFIIPLILLILLPAASFADAGKIFKENNKAVVVVVAYDEKGEAISQGSGFIVRADGAIVTSLTVLSSRKGLQSIHPCLKVLNQTIQWPTPATYLQVS